jgi:hypothetical protein
MLALRSLVGASLLSSAWAEECTESASLIQVKPQRQDPKRNESEDLEVNLLARAAGKVEVSANAIGKELTGIVGAGVDSHSDWKADNSKCDLERTMNSKGPQNFENGPHKSMISDKEYQYASEDEFAILDKINEVRQKGFTCKNADGTENHFPPKCRNEDLIFDCRLWFAAKQHSEDMGARNYYAHDTQYPFPSGKSYGNNADGSRKLEPFNKRVHEYAWGMAAHKEVLMGASGAQDTPDVIVQSWLDSYGHCMALGTKDAEIAAIGRAPCTARSSGICIHQIGEFTSGLLSQRGFLFWGQANKLDTSCYPETRNKTHR